MVIVREILFLVIATATVLGAALVAVPVLRRASAAQRGRMLGTALVLGLALPALLPVLPRPTRTAPADTATAPTPAAVGGAAVAAAPAAPTDPAPAPDWPLALLGAWLLGCAVCAARLGHAHHRAGRLAAGAAPLAAGPQADLLARLRTGDLPPVRLAVSARTATPLTVGWRRPVIVLPPEADAWSAFELTAVLRHELAHVRRRDNAVALAGGLLACLHWFDPLVWWVLARWRREAEAACDDDVVRRGVRPSAYARILLARACPEAPGAVPALAAAPFAASIGGRLADLLDARTNRSASSRRMGLAAAAVLLVLVLPLTALRPAVLAAPLPTAGAEAERPGGPAWWRELRAEMSEMKALNRWRRDPSAGLALPAGTLAGDGWTLETRDAVVLPGSKYGCVFTSDTGYVRVAFADGGSFGVGAITHPPLGKLERMVDRMLAPFGLDTDGEPRGYRIDGWGTDRELDRFRSIVQQAAQRAGSESP